MELPSGLWVGINGLPVLPQAIFSFLAKLTHGPHHVSKGWMLDIVNRLWHAPGFSTFAENFYKNCVICATYNVSKGVAMPIVNLKVPFEHLMMDFVELTSCRVYKYGLVIVDMFSKWIECFPCK